MLLCNSSCTSRSFQRFVVLPSCFYCLPDIINIYLPVSLMLFSLSVVVGNTECILKDFQLELLRISEFVFSYLLSSLLLIILTIIFLRFESFVGLSECPPIYRKSGDGSYSIVKLVLFLANLYYNVCII